MRAVATKRSTRQKKQQVPKDGYAREETHSSGIELPDERAEAPVFLTAWTIRASPRKLILLGWWRRLGWATARMAHGEKESKRQQRDRQHHKTQYRCTSIFPWQSSSGEWWLGTQ
jgi:hypothetical protein